MVKNIGLIACSKTKLLEAKNNPEKLFKAQDMYESNIFKDSKEIGLKKFNCQDWYILSGKMEYNLLEKDEKIKYYDCYLGKQSIQYKEEWSKKVIAKLKQKFDLNSDDYRFYIFGGRNYYEKLLPYIKHSVVFRFKSSGVISLDEPEEYSFGSIR